MLNRISIRQRFALGFGILLTILIGLSLFASWRVNEIAQNLQTINHVNSIKQRYAINFRGAVHERAITIRDVVIVPDQVDLNTAIARINLMAANYDKSAGPMDAIMASGAQVTPDEVSILASIKATQAMTMPVIQRIIALRENGDIKDATSMVLAQAKPDFIQWLDQINQFIDLEEAKNKAIGDETAAIADGFFWLNFAACGLGLLLGFTIAWWSMQALGPLKDIVKIMGRIAAGHVNVSIPCIERGDEVGAIARAVQVFKENAVERQKLELAAAQFQRELAAKLKEMEARFEADFATKSALEVARNTAEELSRVKSDFLAAMSHELRTPMNVIIGMSRLCLQTGLEPKQRNYIEKVRRSADHLLGLINQVLDFSKAEAGKLAMEEANFNLDDVMANLANLVTAKAEEKGLDFLFDFAPDVPIFLIGDALRLGQVLVNLASNAIKFTARGEVIIGAARLGLSAHDVELHFWVKDSGIGMTEEQQSRLFQLYGQADATIARTYGGTGLGLAISKKLVEMMDGKIWIESEFGKGSTMHFTARFGLPAKPMSRAVNIPVDLASKRLLVVDDNAAAREILVTMARSFGLHADSAWDGRQALASIESNDTQGQPYDFVLMDWQMPNMDGVECIRLIYLAELSKLPAIIMVTAECSREDALTQAQRKHTLLKSVLSKPISASTLLEALNEAIGSTDAPAPGSFRPVSRRTGAMRKLRGARLLLVEDNALNQELAGELLAQAGIVTVIANHGREALEILAHDICFDGILMDCQMPVMDGFATTREIRKNPAFGAMPIIAMTANAMAGDREKVIAAGMAEHIAKPLDVDQMFETIARWITPAHPAASAPETPVAAAPLAFELPGIDTKAGLAITMNNEKLYLNLLRQFHAAEANFAGAFRLAQRDEDHSAPARSAHTLRGSAGNIGAKGVQAAAAALEEACINGMAAEGIAAMLAATLAALRPVIAGLAALERRKISPLLAGGLGKKLVAPLLARLIALLEDNNLEAGDVVQELAACVENTALAEMVEQAAEAVACFDVDLALSILRIVAIKIERE